MSKAAKYCLMLIVVLAMGLAVLFFLRCYHRLPSQLVTGHSETTPGQPSVDDDIEDHCFRQETTASRQNEKRGKAVVVILTMPEADPKKLDIHLFNLNRMAPGNQYDEVTAIDTHERQPLGDGRIAITIVDKPPQLRSHLGPGPYMVAASNPTGDKDGGGPPKLFYYYETYQKDLSECAKYRE